jgi:hypothetical protein
LFELVGQHPVLGVGPGWLEEATGVVRIAHDGSIARFRHVIGSAESTPLGLLVRTGFVGFGLALAGTFVWLRGIRERHAFEVRPALATVAAVAVLGIFHDFLDQDVVLWWWAVVVGVAMAACRSGGAVRQAERTVGRPGRTTVATCFVGIILWGMVQPAVARSLWWSQPSSVRLFRAVLRAEPWFAEAAQWRSRDLLGRPQWTWQEAAEAVHWSRRAARYHCASAGVWSEYGRVYAKITEDLGGWPDAIEGAREGFRRATRLEPHLPWHWLRWAQFERGLGELDESRIRAERAVAEEPRFVRGWLFMARLELDMGRPDAARDAVARAVAASDRARWRLLSAYERDLTKLPLWQLAELNQELAQPRGD